VGPFGSDLIVTATHAGRAGLPFSSQHRGEAHMLVWVIVASVGAILLLVAAVRIDLRARRQGRLTGVDEVKLRTRSTPRE
jgi:beta-lactamase regulating signal transducer with metallopeptidase domain